MKLFLLNDIINKYLEAFFDSNLYGLNLDFFQFLSYYLILMSLFNSIIGVYDINNGKSAHLATLNSTNFSINILLQIVFCILTIFFCNQDFFFLSSFQNLKSFFTVDYYILWSSMIVSVSGILILCLSSTYILQTRKDTLELPTLFCFSISFMFFLLSANNLMSAFVSLEGLSFVLYVLSALNFSSHLSIEAAVKYFCLGGLSSGILLFGISVIYGVSGTLNFLQLRRYFGWLSVQDFSLGGNFNLILWIATFFIIAGFLFKLSSYPFHYWTPDVYEGAPLIITAFFAIVVKFTIFMFFLRIYNFVFLFFNTSFFLFIPALGSIIIGSLGALKQQKLKRFVAYTSINQVGFLLLALANSSFYGNCAAILHLLVYIVMSFGLFAFLLGVSNFFDEISLSFLHDLKNFGQKNTTVSWAFTVILFSMAGVPPLGGFFGKYLILLSTLMGNYHSNIFIVIIVLLVNVISTFYYIRIIKYIWFGSLEVKSLFFFYNESMVFFFVLNLSAFFLIFTIFFIPQLINFCIYLAKGITPTFL